MADMVVPLLPEFSKTWKHFSPRPELSDFCIYISCPGCIIGIGLLIMTVSINVNIEIKTPTRAATVAM